LLCRVLEHKTFVAMFEMHRLDKLLMIIEGISGHASVVTSLSQSFVRTTIVALVKIGSAGFELGYSFSTIIIIP